MRLALSHKIRINELNFRAVRRATSRERFELCSLFRESKDQFAYSRVRHATPRAPQYSYSIGEPSMHSRAFSVPGG
jgi:hypothetical protein